MKDSDYQSDFSKRAWSFVWRFSFAVIIFSLEWLASNFGVFNLPTPITLALAYLINELTKQVREDAKRIGV